MTNLAKKIEVINSNSNNGEPFHASMYELPEPINTLDNQEAWQDWLEYNREVFGIIIDSRQHCDHIVNKFIDLEPRYLHAAIVYSIDKKLKNISTAFEKYLPYCVN